MDRLFDLLLHFDQHLSEIIRVYGPGTYGILFSIIFCETGLVVTPFLPGDSLIFAAGIFAHPSREALNPVVLFFLFMAGAFAGDNLNYQIGRLFGRKLFRNENSRIFKRSYLDRTHTFYERYGSKTVVIARFVPIVRTFSPFVAGMGSMAYPKFILYSLLGAALWVGIFLGAGYWLGHLVLIQQNFPMVVASIIAISVAPIFVELIRARLSRSQAGE